MTPFLPSTSFLPTLQSATPIISQPTSLQIIVSITAIQNVAPQHFLISLHAPEIARRARAGQFVHVLPRERTSADPFLRRAFSIMAVRGEEIDILFRVEGRGTAQIAGKHRGETLDVLGPLGQPFDLSLFHVKQDENQGGRQGDEQSGNRAIEMGVRTPILVAGGVGVPPMVFLGATLKAMGIEPLMLIGARSAGEFLGLDDFRQLQIETRTATDDGSAGHAGRVTQLLEFALQTQPRAVVYACGPLPMLRAVAQMAARFGAACQVSLEENMPCGIGVCNGCVVAMKADAEAGCETEGESQKEKANLKGGDYGRYRRICVAGPALWANEVDWEAF